MTVTLPPPRTGGWTERLWVETADTYAAILAHPFLLGLTSGDLDPATFAHYLAQDVHYLRDYARTLAVIGAKAPNHADTGMLAGQAATAIEVEFVLNTALVADLDIDASSQAAAPVAPTTHAYTSFLLATAYGGSFAEGLAAVLPCYWMYAEIGRALAGVGSPDPRYQRWIDTYAGEEYAATVRLVLDLADRVGLELGVADEARARERFAVAARYEWMFWDGSWRRESWPV
jgi:thiaminase (transcriptional activator TenA)